VPDRLRLRARPQALGRGRLLLRLRQDLFAQYGRARHAAVALEPCTTHVLRKYSLTRHAVDASSETPLLDEGPERADRHFSGAVGGAATDRGHGPGRRSPEGPPSGAIPVPDVARLEFLPRAQARSRTVRERASWGT
jgi:hypothetical protein